MTAGSWVRVAAWKEFRALLPVWAAGMSVAFVIAMVGYPWPAALNDLWRLARDVAPVLFGIVPIVLGAQAIGHEFATGTFATLLTQPVARARLFVVKLAVLYGAVLSLAALAFFAYGKLRPAVYADLMAVGVAEFLVQPLVLIPLVGGLVLAPWFTLMSRTAIGGMVLSLSVPAVALLAALLVRWLRFGTPETLEGYLRAAETLDTAWVVIMLSVAALALWRLPVAFVSMEVRDGGSGNLAAFRWREVARGADVPLRHRPAYWLLLLKELRLQVPTFVMAVLFVLLWMTTALVAQPESGMFQTYQVFFAALTPLLAGALATADERDQGLLDGDAMLPLPAGRRYGLKLLVVLTISIVCTAGASGLLAWVTGHGVALWIDGRHALVLTLSAPLLLASAGLYTSSVSRGALRALVSGGTTVFVGGVLLQVVTELVAKYVTRFHYWWTDNPIPSWAYRGFSAVPRAWWFAPLIAIAVVGMLAIWFAYQNQRFADRTTRRIALQLGTLVAFYATATLALEVVVRDW